MRLLPTVGRNGGKSNWLLDSMRELQLINNKHIPPAYKCNNRKVRLAVLAGLIDSDGYYGNGCYEIITKFDRLSDDILYLARSLGFAAYRHDKIVDYKGESRLYHRIVISGDISNVPVLLERKKAGERKTFKDVLRTGFSISEEVNRSQYIRIITSDVFVLGDFTIFR